jgi:cytidylate kinase
MIITIDGPAGAGKSTVAKLLAHRLSERLNHLFAYLDTGSMYRAVALSGLRHDVDWNAPTQLENLARKINIDVRLAQTFLDGENITDVVRTPEVIEKIRFAADNAVIRTLLVDRQRQIAERNMQDGNGLVTEGRDQGTVVFPDSVCKFFLTATLEERTKRRLGELKQRKIDGVFDEVYRQIKERDERDSNRPVAPLREPVDAVRIVSDGMSIDDVVGKMIEIAVERSVSSSFVSSDHSPPVI